MVLSRVFHDLRRDIVVDLFLLIEVFSVFCCFQIATINDAKVTNIMQPFCFIHSYVSSSNSSEAEEILHLAQEINTVPTTQINQIVSDSIKHAGNGVAQYIFNTDVKNAKWGEADCSSFRDELAVKLVAWTVTKVSIDFLIDNIFVLYGGRVFQQAIGIPMGTNCAPLLADLFLHAYEADFLQELHKNKDRKLSQTFSFQLPPYR